MHVIDDRQEPVAAHAPPAWGKGGQDESDGKRASPGVKQDPQGWLYPDGGEPHHEAEDETGVHGELQWKGEFVVSLAD